MQNNITISHVFSILADLLIQVEAQIDRATLLKGVPAFTAVEMFDLIYEISHLQLIRPPDDIPLREENLQDISKLQKDTLMPKDLSQEKIRVQSPKRASPRSSASSMRKLAFQKRQTSQLVQKLQSVSFTQKKQSKRKSKVVDETVYLQLKLQSNNNQQLDVEALRQKTEARLHYGQEQIKIKQERQKLLQSKLNELNHIKEELKAHVTYDYEGDPLASNMGDYQNLRVNMTRTGIGFATKRLKQGISKINAPQESKIQVRQKVSKSLKQDYNGPLRPLQMPMFPMKYIDTHEATNLKLQQYKKFYGHKYNRLDQRNHTIDMNATARTNKRQDTFTDQRHLKDANNQQQNFIAKARATQRKLALPKLNGKYKVLDRYE